MCLSHDAKSTKSLRSKMESKEIWFYKVYNVAEKSGRLSLHAPCMDMKVTPTKAGFIKSNRLSSELSSGEEFEVSLGIHVLRTEKAIADNFNMYTDRIVLKVTADPSDLVAASSDCAVFTKIKVDMKAVRKRLTSPTFIKQLKKYWSE
jgi:hypothetical protein